MLILERPRGLDSSAAGKINRNFKKICFTQFFCILANRSCVPSFMRIRVKPEEQRSEKSPITSRQRSITYTVSQQ